MDCVEVVIMEHVEKARTVCAWGVQVSVHGICRKSVSAFACA